MASSTLCMLAAKCKIGSLNNEEEQKEYDVDEDEDDVMAELSAISLLWWQR